MDNILFFILALSSSIAGLLLTYPVLCYVRAMLIKRPVNRSEEFEKPVSIIIAAYNEEFFVRDKVQFFLRKEEFMPGSEVIVVSAGSTDNTNKILLELSSIPEVKPIIIDEFMVKPLALNIAVSRSKNDILIFSDCRQEIKTGSVKKLLRYFNDEKIGTVNSTISDTRKGGKISVMRRILNSICLNDSVSGSSLNIHGALYAQRRNLFREFPANILFDDLFAIVSTIIQNKRLVQARDVMIYDINFDNYYGKDRIERLARGLIIYLVGHWRSIKKMPASVLVRFIIYRYLKLLLPFLLIGIILPAGYFLAPILHTGILYISFSLIAFLLIYKKTRELILLFVRVNVYFFSAIFKFIAMNERHVHWNKLEPERLH